MLKITFAILANILLLILAELYDLTVGYIYFIEVVSLVVYAVLWKNLRVAVKPDTTPEELISRLPPDAELHVEKDEVYATHRIYSAFMTTYQTIRITGQAAITLKQYLTAKAAKIYVCFEDLGKEVKGLKLGDFVGNYGLTPFYSWIFLTEESKKYLYKGVYCPEADYGDSCLVIGGIAYAA